MSVYKIAPYYVSRLHDASKDGGSKGKTSSSSQKGVPYEEEADPPITDRNGIA